MDRNDTWAERAKALDEKHKNYRTGWGVTLFIMSLYVLLGVVGIAILVRVGRWIF